MRLAKQLSDDLLKKEILNQMINISDKQYGTALRKKAFIQTILKLHAERRASISKCCRLFGISRQGLYQTRKEPELLIKESVETYNNE